MKHLTEALDLIRQHPDLAEFAGPREEVLVAAAEQALGGRFPPTYRAFIGALGAGNFGAFEIYGVIDRDFMNSSVPDGIWLTLNARQKNKLPPKLLIVGSLGDGREYCLELRDGAESPVTLRWLGRAEQSETIASDFGVFLLEGIRDELVDE